MAVSDSTAFEDARRALRCAIWQRQGRKIDGHDWISVVPGADFPDGLENSKAAWTETLRFAADILRSWQYSIPKPTLADAGSVLNESLNRSVRLLFESMEHYRPLGVATSCNAGDPA